MRPASKGGSSSRPFSFGQRALLAFASIACAAGALADEPPGSGTPAGAPALLALGTAGATRVALLDCAIGRALAEAAVPAGLAAQPVVASGGGAVYASTRGRELLRLAVPDLGEQARATLEFEADVLAAADGADAVVLAGGRGPGALSAHDPATLAPVQRYLLPEPFTVSAIHDLPARRRFAVAFADLDEVWEIAYDRDAPPVLQGLVHDYRSNEAVPLPGRLTPRRFTVQRPTRALLDGPVPYELARIDAAGALGIVHLDVRREIERPALSAAPQPGRAAPWRSGARRGWLFSAPGAADAERLESGAWRVTGRVIAPGEILAMAASAGRVLAAYAVASGVAVAAADVPGGRFGEPLAQLRAPSLPLRFVAGTGGCLALVDRDDRWLAGFAMPALR
ncbi:MAG: hypothetical protein U1F17_12545 [Burkholderiaceae bacterium]